ncbi:hypothetical protein [Enterocloster citroniae]|uniref:hypothetical protein n=1 Tax=Enterocloster citroniae TaxID=358743 RepID=UPI0022E5C331|nr:hypothetical protein [Enterocloster citroniae]
MFLKTAELKKMMKSALKGAGLYVGNIAGNYLVYGSTWGLSTDTEYASNKFKAALTELIGDIPESGECYRYYMQEKQVAQDSCVDYPDIHEAWKAAKDYAVRIPLNFVSWPHEFNAYQIHSNGQYVIVPRSQASDVISMKELDNTVESMPGRASFMTDTLYWKNDTTIYWVTTVEQGERARDTLFRALEGLDFFNSDWLPKEDEEEIPYA